MLIVALIPVQATLGALTVLSRLEVWINSLHVVCGALVLTSSLVLTLRSWRLRFAARTVPMIPDASTEFARRVHRQADVRPDASRTGARA